jgi:cephalosporin-C deacetylase-like acetyl esterase
MAMRTSLLALSAAAVLLISSVQAQETAAPRPVAPVARPDPNGPSQIGRTQLANYLNSIAATQTAKRREGIARIQTRAEAEAHQREVRAKILHLLGDLPEETPLNPVTVSTFQANGFRMEKVLFYSQPNFPITAILYLPDKPTGKLPAIVIAPGHGATGKASDYAFASLFAHNGFVVLSYDPIGQGERLQYPDPAHPGQSLASRPTGEHGEAGLQPTLIGDTFARYELWDGIRAVDYLLTRNEVDSNRIGAFGCSGGGTITALLGALDPRVKAVGTACYITSFDTLLPSIGPQDAEQSISNFIASGLDFPDWIELAAPRPYAVISTASDMFPYAGARASVIEGRRFYSLFDPTAAGTPTNQPEPGIPTGPTLNPDTSDTIAPTAPLQWITGIGGHGNLRPLQSQIVSFFLTHLAHSAASPSVPLAPAGTNPFALPPNFPKDIFQVTSTGQVATSYPNAETVHTLNLKRYVSLSKPKPLTTSELQHAVREVTHATVKPEDPAPINTQSPPLASPPEGDVHVRHRFTLATAPGIDIQAEFYRPSDGKHPVLLILKDSLDPALEPSRVEEIRKLRAIADAGTAVLVIAPRPSPPGNEETKSSILGPFYLTELRAELVGKTLVGLRVDDVISAVSFTSGGTTVDPNQITAQASGHLGLVLLHAAVLDPRLKHITIDHTLPSYKSLLEARMPIDAHEDILPGVLRRYDLPDLIRELGARLAFSDSLQSVDESRKELPSSP